MGELIELGVSDAYLAELRKEWETIPDCSRIEGYEQVKQGLGKIVKTRTGIEAARKKLTKPLLDKKKEIDTEAKRLIGALSEIEKPLKEAKTAQDDRIERARQAEIQREAERQERITRKIAAFNMVVLKAIGKPSEQMQNALNTLNEIDTADCDERKQVADESLEQAKEKLAEMIETKRRSEELEKRETELLAREKAAEEAEAKRKTEEAERRKEALTVFGPNEIPSDFRKYSGGFDLGSGDTTIVREIVDGVVRVTDMRAVAENALIEHAKITEDQAMDVMGCIIMKQIPGVSWNG